MESCKKGMDTWILSVMKQGNEQWNNDLKEWTRFLSVINREFTNYGWMGSSNTSKASIRNTASTVFIL
jgi:hypothetical protein